MDQTQQSVLAEIAKDLQLPVESISVAVQLLDEGNTIPFITRFRKDKTGNLDGRQLRDIRHCLNQKRGLAERKNYIVKSIESQGKLDDEFKQKIESANTPKDLEDLFLPFKPKKQSLATTAKQKGLEPLARDILEGVSPEIDLATRSTDFVRVDKGLTSIDEVIEGVSHIIAERFSESIELRSKLRSILWESGKLVTSKVENEQANDASNTSANLSQQESESDSESAKEPTGSAEPVESQPTETNQTESDEKQEPAGENTNASDAAAQEVNEPANSEASAPETGESESQVEVPVSSAAATDSPEAETSESNEPVSLPAAEGSNDSESETVAEEQTVQESSAGPKSEPAKEETATTAEKPAKKPKKKKKKKKKTKEDTQFQDYFSFSENLKKIPPHRVLAINRGERAKKIRVRIERDSEKTKQTVNELLVPADHPFQTFLEKCATDSLNRLIIPAIEREIRRELTENAEQHALQVFERNLRMLLLQPPVRANKLMAIDPGFRSGCHVAILDQFGQLIANDRFHIVGNQQKLAAGKELLVKLINDHGVDLIAIGNGTGCRATEQLISDIIQEHFSSGNLRFVIVNEAGTSVYSTSDTGREELANSEPVVRSAISIGRRLLDPLSELVKVNPANLGVGLYQHDVKAKHLSQALDESVEGCVNFVGVDVNTASPSLLRYISGLGQLTARRLVEYRQENGPFKNRQELKNISGFGDATFVQSAGFLRVYGGDQLLDGSSIHPESYELVSKILDKVGFGVDDLQIRRTPSFVPQPKPANDTEAEKAAVEGQPQAESLESSVDDSAKTNGESNLGDTVTDSAPADGGSAPADGGSAPTDGGSAPAEGGNPPAEGGNPPAESAVNGSPAAETTGAEASAETVPEPVTEIAEQEPVAETTSVELPESGTASPEPTPALEAGSEGGNKNDDASGDDRNRVDPEVAARNRELRDKLKALNTAELAKELNVGELLIKDLIFSLMRPGRDPRFDLPKPIFRRGIIKLEDLKAGMQLKAQVLNVVDFGVFVDIGLGESSLIHISQLSRKFVRDPYRFFSIGDILNVWVNEVDLDRRRVSLTAIRPDSGKPSRGRPKSGGQRSDGPKGRGQRRRNDGAKGGKRSEYSKRVDRPKRPKAPPKPITKGMVEGEEPMRSFSDLAQFYKLKDDESDEK